jgi:hypothetical protein
MEKHTEHIVGVSTNFYRIVPKDQSAFNVSNWAGRGYALEGGWGFLTVGYGGNAEYAYPSDYWPATYSTKMMSFGASLGAITYQRTRTFIFISPYSISNVNSLYPGGMFH